jgi:uncharacterized protein YecE (DUF72 family)
VTLTREPDFNGRDRDRKRKRDRDREQRETEQREIPSTTLPSLASLMRMTYEEWDEWTRGSAIRRAGYAGLRRNVAVALGNWGVIRPGRSPRRSRYRGVSFALPPGMIRLGMCGFTIAAAAYYRRFRAVEVQQTFYDPPPLATLQRWRAEAPADFEFTLKAWQVITHLGTSRTYRRLQSDFPDHARAEAGAFRPNDTVFTAWLATLQCAEVLRATAVLFQCPPSFGPTAGNMENMRDFFRLVDRPSSLRFLWEPRGPWPDDTVHGLCHELDLIHAVDAFVQPSLTPALLYWRLHGSR